MEGDGDDWRKRTGRGRLINERDLNFSDSGVPGSIATSHQCATNLEGRRLGVDNDDIHNGR